MTETLTSAKIYANVSAGWTDISSSLIGGMSWKWGMDNPNDHVADTGILQFQLNTSSGTYTPGHASCTAGWEKGTEIKLIIIYDTDSYTRFRGVVDKINIKIISPTFITANVTVVDWMNYAAEHPVITPAIQVDKRADEALSLIIDSMPVKPIVRNFDTGVNTFPSVFDVTREQTTAVTEFNKLMYSEQGYLYLQKDHANGEKLIFENAQHRNGLLDYAYIPLPTAECGFLLLETGDNLLLETGGSILLNQTEQVTFDDVFSDKEIVYGDNLINRIMVKSYPRKLDSSATVLYTLGSSRQIGSGETVQFNANYNNPVGGNPCGGFDMVTPVATTDYTLNTLEEGGGTDLTSTAVVTATFGANSADVIVRNGTALSGYINFLQLRGKGIYTYDTETHKVEDTTSINAYGYFERTIDQKYTGDLSKAVVSAKTMLYHNRTPRNTLRSVKFLANRNSDNMLSFLNNDIGSLINVTESIVGLSGPYIIHSISCQLTPPNMIWVTYGLIEHYSLLTSSLMALKLTFSDNTQDGINYGYLPQVVQTADRTYAAWVYCTGAADSINRTILSAPFADGGGVYIYLDGLTPTLYSNLFNTSPGAWSRTAGAISGSALTHVAWTYDAWDVDAIPILYINGGSAAVTEALNPAGTLNSEYGAEVVVGNWHSDTQNYDQPFDGYLQDVRIYNRILTAAEITTLYNGGTPSTSVVTSGLVFQGPVCTTRGSALYDNGAALTPNLKVLENIYQAVGIPTGAPTSDLW